MAESVTDDVVAPTDYSDLNDPPGDLDQLPPAPTAPTTPAVANVTPPNTPSTTYHPSALIQAARDLGIRDSVIQALPTDDLIAHTLDMQRKLASLDTWDASRQQALPPQKPVHQPIAEDSDDSVLDYLEKDVGADPKLINLLRARFKKQSELESRFAQKEELESIQRAATVEEAIDDTVAELGPKAEQILGKGSLRSLPQNSAERQARIDLYNAAGITPLDSDRVASRKFKAVALRLLGTIIKAKEPEATNAYDAKPTNGHKTKEEWDAGTLARPTASKPTKTRSQKAAAEAIRDQMSEWGIHAGSQADEYDGLPN